MCDQLCDEALRLARLLVALMPGDAETLGLLALLLLTTARRPARTGAAGGPVGLEDQDRSRWDRALYTTFERIDPPSCPRGGRANRGAAE